MRTGILCTWLVVAAPLLPQDTGSPWPKQRPTEGTRPAEWIEELEAALQSRDDRTAVDAMVRLSGKAPEIQGTEVGRSAVRALEKALSQRRPQDQESLYVVALETLALLGRDGEKAALKSLRSRIVTERPAVLGAALRAVGRSADPRNIEVLFEHVSHPGLPVAAAAVEALAFYEYSDVPTRKEIVKGLTRTYSDTLSASRNSRPGAPPPKAAQERLQVLQVPLQKTLQRLTGESFPGAEEWADWFRDHEDQPWPEQEAQAESS